MQCSSQYTPAQSPPPLRRPDSSTHSHRRCPIVLPEDACRATSDVLSLREIVLNTADTATLEALECRDEVYIVIVTAGGYEYSVAMLAVLALGAAAVPITPALPVEEPAYFVEKSKSALVLVSSFDLIASTSNEHFRDVPIEPCT
ncbi:hypothetical protein BDU57DRAFT_510915 [Ampelomyces quisqualis]|uniref:AMP-dependent synthetase/ligase domain-containing protein n=1 Tax=Ampelomyces quisqualis TaxID=50730 RepID=A0A6A5R3X9_AMPQU|nr:hypothetical protein BDU57DRAFT_510915 [Ampelomyces quisqualis]